MRPSSEKLRKLFKYEPDTGLLFWRVSPAFSVRPGDRAGTIINGYVRITIEGQRYSAHRIVWAMMTGLWPKKDLDHVNRVRRDNRWVNLREATPTQNRWNTDLRTDNTSGVKNVSFNKSAQLWRVETSGYGKRDIRHFKQFDAAVAAAKTLPNREFMSCFATDATDATDAKD